MDISTSAVPLSTARRCYRFCYYRWRPRRCFWSCRRRSAFRSAWSTWCPWAGWSWCPLGWRSRQSYWPRWRTRRLKRCTSVFLVPEAIDKTELTTRVKVEVAVPGSPSLISLVVSVDVKEHWNKSTRRACGTVLGMTSWMCSEPLLLTGMTSPLPDEKYFSYEWINHWKGTTQFAYCNVFIKRHSVLHPLCVTVTIQSKSGERV